MGVLLWQSGGAKVQHAGDGSGGVLAHSGEEEGTHVSDNVLPVYFVFIRIKEETDRLTCGTILNSLCMLRMCNELDWIHVLIRS